MKHPADPRQLQKQQFLLSLGYALAVAGLIAAVLWILRSFLLPFVLGLGVALLLHPLIQRLSRVTPLPPRLSALLVTTGLYLLVVLGAWWLWLFLADRVPLLTQRMTQELPPLVEELAEQLRYWASRISPALGSWVEKGWQLLTEQLSALAVQWAGAIAAGTPGVVVTLGLGVLSSYLIAMDYQRITGFLLGQLPFSWQRLVLRCRHQLFSTLGGMVRGYLTLLAITFSLLWAGMWLLKIPHPVGKAALVAILDLLPIIGVGSVLIPWGVLSLARGNQALGVGLFVLYGVIVTLRGILEPRVLGKHIGIPPLLTMITIYAGWKAGGFWGMLTALTGGWLILWLQRSGVVRWWKEGESSSKEK